MIRYALSRWTATDASIAFLAGLVVVVFIIIVSGWVRVITPLVRALNRLREH